MQQQLQPKQGGFGKRMQWEPRLAGMAKLALMRCRSSATTPASLGANELAGFTDRSLQSWRLAVLGDLHLAPDQMPELFYPARTQLVNALAAGTDGQSAARVVQLGDLGHGKHKSGSRRCFEYAREYLSGFGFPTALVLGNHDLEGDEFETDAENLAAWKQVFGQPHHWSAWLGPALLVGLSTTRYRSNEYSHHEVHIDDSQLAWLEGLLTRHPDSPVVLFTHAPPMGCGLKVLQEIHVKNRCAWLNHSSDPHVFMRLLDRHANRIRLWFSGHFHLSHNYLDSVSLVGSAAFVQVGVIGDCNRDGNRQSRLLEGDAQGFRLYTVDHDNPDHASSPRLDVVGSWYGRAAPLVVTPEEELVCDPSAGWLCSQLDCKVGDESSGMVKWLAIGPSTMLALQDELLVEYDMATSAPIGLVAKVPEGSSVALLGPGGAAPVTPDGADADTVRITLPTGEVKEFGRNPQGGFFQIYQPNKWRLKRQQAAEAAAAAAAAALVPS